MAIYSHTLRVDIKYQPGKATTNLKTRATKIADLSGGQGHFKLPAFIIPAQC